MYRDNSKTRWPRSGSRRTASSNRRPNSDCRTSGPAIASFFLELFCQRIPTPDSFSAGCPGPLLADAQGLQDFTHVQRNVQAEQVGMEVALLHGCCAKPLARIEN